MRESGWYRVKFLSDDDWEFALYFSDYFFWITAGDAGEWRDYDFHEIDPKMVMTPAGEIVYHSAEHDPVYNTKQEG
ncbi:MAG: hypothetical protein ACRCYD_01870 [Plesiomonas sp.]